MRDCRVTVRDGVRGGIGFLCAYAIVSGAAAIPLLVLGALLGRL